MSTADWARCGDEWATVASQQALMQVDTPRLENVQACQNLSMYWFAVGQIRRTNIHARKSTFFSVVLMSLKRVDIAYHTCRLLGYHNVSPPHEHRDTLDEERKRRCFWSCWITSCISQDNASFRATSWEDAVGICLPSDETSFSSGYPISDVAFDVHGDVKPIAGYGDGQSRGSILAEVAKMFSLWYDSRITLCYGAMLTFQVGDPTLCKGEREYGRL